jgi:hypothetical protein
VIRRIVVACALALALSGAALAQDDDPERRREDQSPEDERGTAFERVRGAPRENVPGGRLLVMAYGAVWLVVFGYIGYHWRQQSRVRDDLARVERALEEGGKKG